MARGGKRPSAGRPKGRRNKITAAANATLTEMARGYTEEMLDLLVAVARGEIEASSGRIHAIEGVLDRGSGKPATTMEITQGPPKHNASDWSHEELIAVVAQGAGK
jgi:hypothetical protein